VKKPAWNIGVQMMAEFGGRIARGHPERLADLHHILLVVRRFNYG